MYRHWNQEGPDFLPVKDQRDQADAAQRLRELEELSDSPGLSNRYRPISHDQRVAYDKVMGELDTETAGSILGPTALRGVRAPATDAYKAVVRELGEPQVLSDEDFESMTYGGGSNYNSSDENRRVTIDDAYVYLGLDDGTRSS